MSFAFPLAFLLLALPPLLARFLAPRIERGGAVEVPPSIAEDMGVEVLPAARRRLARLALYAAWGLAVLAIAGPRQMQTIDVPTDSGRDIVLVLDLSGSMATEDFDLDGRRVSRLEAVQAVAARFVLGRAGDRVGLVVFGDRAYVAAGLTHDVAAVAHMVATSAIGVSGESTAIADGLGLALKRLRAREAESRVVVLLSDGKDTTGVVDPGAAALKARALGIRVHTIALGPDASDADTHPGNVVDVAMLER
ncbi:MAG: VWA domain-containing protein, partial [Pseudomonadota bacterium]